MDLTTTKAAARLGRDARLVRLWCQQGHFPGAYLEETPRGSVWMIPESALKNFVPPKMGRPRNPKKEAA